MASGMKYAVFGEGKGGLAVAGRLLMKGAKVNFLTFREMQDYVAPLQQGGGITVTGIRGEGFVRLNKVTINVGEALKDVDVIAIVVEAQRQKRCAELCAPHLEDGQIVLLQPGNAGGALEFIHTLKQLGVVKDVPVAETVGLFLNYRRGPTAVEIIAVKNDTAVGVFPGSRTQEIVDALSLDFDELAPAANVLETSLSNINHILHPPIGILNVGRTEDTEGDFGLYTQGFTTSVAKLMEVSDEERVAVVRACGLVPVSLKKLLLQFYGDQGASGQSLYEVIKYNPAYQMWRAPPTIHHRFFTEDIPYGLVFISSLGKLLRVPAPSIDAMITLGSIVTGTDYWAQGRTAEKVGLAGMDAARMKEFVMEGR